MTQNNSLTTQPIQPDLLGKRMLIGAGIGLLVISLFLFGANDSDPAWGKFWRIRPLIVVALAGAMGGLCNYFIFRRLVGVNKIIPAILSAIVFLFGLWVGIILGLDGTLWN